MPPENDGLTDDEQRQLDTFMTTDQTVPPPLVEEGVAPELEAKAPPAAPAPAPAPAPAADPAAPAPAAPAAPAPAPDGNEDERFAAWQAQHAGKSPEEMVKLAFQQSQRASRQAFESRQATERLTAAQDRVRAAAERRAAGLTAIEGKRAAFDETLRNDPDAAAKQIHEDRLAGEAAAFDSEERAARVDAAITMASTAFEDFHERAPAIYAFGGELGYSKDELAAISDGRDLVTLALADMAGRLIKGGLMDTRGNLLAGPKPVTEEPTDPRLTAQTPHQSLSSAPARPAGGGRNITQQANDLLNMSDADYDRLPPAELDALLRQLQAS